MSTTSTDLLHLTRIDATLWKDSRYAYTKHTYYGWRSEPIEEHVWRREYKPIGAGAFGAVFREVCIEGRNKAAVRAVKHIEKPTASQRATRVDFSRELEAIARFSKPEYEPFFVRSEGWYDGGANICIVMELVQHGSLQDYVRQSQGLPEPEARLIVSQTLRGIAHMHRAGYTHRDLKPQNLLVVQGGPAWHVKIADFGLSKRLVEDLSSLRTVAGTAGYMAPEILGIRAQGGDSSHDSSGSSYTSAVEIWAIGIIYFLLLTGGFPFPAQDFHLLSKYVQGRAHFPVERMQLVSLPARDLVETLLRPHPDGRPSADSCLDHTWFNFQERLPMCPSSHDSASDSSVNREISPQTRPFSTRASASWNGTEDTDRTMIAVKQPMQCLSGEDNVKALGQSNTPFLRTRDQQIPAASMLVAGAPIKVSQRVDANSFRRVMDDPRAPLSLDPRHIRLEHRSTTKTRLWFDQVSSSPSGERLIISSAHGLNLCDPATRKSIRALSKSPARPFSFSPDGTLLAFDGNDEAFPRSAVVICDGITGKVLRTIDLVPFTSGSLREVAFISNGQVVCICEAHRATGPLTSKFEAIILDPGRGTTTRKIRLLGSYHDFLFSYPHGALLAAILKNQDPLLKSVDIWDMTTSKIACRIDGLTPLAFSPDNRMIGGFCNESHDHFLRIVDAVKGTDVWRVSVNAKIQDLAFAPNDAQLLWVLYGGADCSLGCFSVELGAEVSTGALKLDTTSPYAHRSGRRRRLLDLSPDGRALSVTCGSEIVWYSVF